MLYISVFPVFATENSQAEEREKSLISELYSDIESFDITLYSEEPEENLTLEAVLVRPKGKEEKVLDRQVFPVRILPANTNVIKVGFWDIEEGERGSYSSRVKLFREEELLSEAEYSFDYAARSVSRLRINDLIPNSEGISVSLSPVEAGLFDIEYILVDGVDAVYTTKTEKAGLTSTPEIFSSTWGTLLENNKEYLGRVKVHVYSPKNEFIVSTEAFTSKDDAKITDIFEDETGASATVLGRSQVPFEGSLLFTVYEMKDESSESSGLNKSIQEPLESIQEAVPVLLSDDDETVEVAWSQRLPEGRYKLEIDLFGNDGDVIEHRETVIESDLSSDSISWDAGSKEKNESQTSSGESSGAISGFSGWTGVLGFAAVFIYLRSSHAL